ncbi:MAG: S8 family serine peptidase, partial [Thermomicrobiaceae bacterium]|nr:S8 family serine peptidase [Thermomicrobiaceae bacterium]
MACALALAAVLLALLAPGAALATGNGKQARTSTGETKRWIVRLRPDVAQYASDAWLGAALGDARVTRLSLPHTLLAEFDGATRPGDAVARLASDPLVASVEPDILYTYEWEPNDPRYPGETWAKTVDLPDAWSIGTGRASVVVAVVDSGVRPDHPDLRGKLTAGYDFLSNDSDPTDTFGHGTAVAGIIAARGNDGVGVAGTAMDVMVMPVRVGDQQGAPVSAIAEGIHYAVDHGASVINLSLGSSSPSATLEDAIQYAYSHGVVVVAAAGNDPNQPSFPATYRETISVGATSIDGKALTNFSSRLSRVDLVAPGDGVLTTSWDPTDGNGYGYGTGTSFSAPIVSGTVALMRAANPGLAVETIRADLTATAQQTLPTDTPGVGSG